MSRKLKTFAAVADMVPLLADASPLTLLPVLAVAGWWYVAPLVASITLVCAATRHELMVPILRHAARFALWITVFMVLFGALLAFLERLA